MSTIHLGCTLDTVKPRYHRKVSDWALRSTSPKGHLYLSAPETSFDRSSYVLEGFSSYGRSVGSTRVRMCEWFDRLSVPYVEHFFVDGPDNSPLTLARNASEVVKSTRKLRGAVREVENSTVFISRRVTPFGSGGIEGKLLRKAQRGVYDFDDALYLTPKRRARVTQRRSSWINSVSSADIVLAGNETLADAASQFADNVHIIPSCVDTAVYDAKSDWELGAYPVAVWIGSRSTESELLEIQQALLAANAEYGLRLLLVGSTAGNLGALERIVDRHAWSADTQASLLRRSDFGLMPLRDSAWNRGKCGYKLLQYGAAALPIIGSPVGVNEAIISGARGLAPTNNDEWYDAVEQYITESNEDRRGRGLCSRLLVESGFSFDANEEGWRNAVLCTPTLE